MPQGALPPRKSASTFAPRSSTRSALFSWSGYRQRQLRSVSIILLFILACLWLFSRSSPRPLSPSQSPQVPAGTPRAVIVTVLDPDLDPAYVHTIKANREDYARRHGYATFYASSTDYSLEGAPRSWAVVPAMRHALTRHPHSLYFFSLSPHSVIMNPKLDLEEHIMEPKRLESLMLKDRPVVPPDSVIHTFGHLKGEKIDLVLTQDNEGLCQESFILKRGEWAQFFLDVWFDPLYRSYNFQKAEGHALEHIVQWHATILAKLALIPIRTMNSYTVNIASRGGLAVTYQPGDFIVRAVGCERDPVNRDCSREMRPWYEQWRRTEALKTATTSDAA